METASLNLFYRLSKEAAIHLFDQEKCKGVRSFSVIQDMSELSTDNLGKIICDKNLPYFYSLAWQAAGYNPSKIIFDWPLLTAFELDFQNRKRFGRQSKRCYRIQLSVLDQYDKDCDKLNCSGCDARTINQIHDDTEAILQNYLSYIHDAEFAVVDGTPRLINSTYLKYLEDNNLVTTVVRDIQHTKIYQNDLRTENENIAGFRREWIAASNVYGTVMTITVCLTYCDNFTPNVSEIKIKEVGDKGCC
jgi:hypothetical protein